MQPQAHIQAFFDEPTNTVTYLVSDPATRQAAVIDPVLDYDHRSGKASTASADRVLEAAHSGDLTVAYVLETHAHADPRASRSLHRCTCRSSTQGAIRRTWKWQRHKRKLPLPSTKNPSRRRSAKFLTRWSAAKRWPISCNRKKPR